MKEIENISPGILNFSEEIILKPDKISFLLSSNLLLLFIIFLSIFLNFLVKNQLIFYYNLILIILVLWFFLKSYQGSKSLFYIISSNGIRYNRTIFFSKRTKEEFLSYDSINEVVFRQSIYESNKNIGSVILFLHEKTDGQRKELKISGIENYKEIAKLITEQVNKLKS